MNIRIRFILFLPFLLWLSGCCPNGCFVLTGEAYRELAYPKPRRDRWIKEGASENDRAQDWEACGGAKNGNFSPYEKTRNAEQRADEKDFINAYQRLLNNVQRCMRTKGYRYKIGRAHV